MSAANVRMPRERASIVRFFALLGGGVFVAGWAGIIYQLGDVGHAGLGFEVFGGAQGRVYLALLQGPFVTIAASILWGVAAWLATAPMTTREAPIRVTRDT